MNKLDPKITVKKALSMTSGNQSELARKLGVTRAVVNEWVRDGRRYIPAIAAYRLQRAFPGEAF